ncbi:hypothetical protein K2173_022010 [Erythroxylum novogranatense]|uniref:C2H2-type domain-containing protein n=1 Tax=Erythroxylum novogranatense TaxID=1862640 RepID=A0AAV8T2J5_9ROSI|nr:hypothetical protein K2173_022010 [Erythroxylum novogranatense]
MEATQKKKFVCKFCNKKFRCGKSLGGHIRIHLNGSSNDVEAEANLNMSKSFAGNEKRDSGFGAAATVQSGYRLRENPKKTKWYMVDSSKSGLLPEKVCKECGKGFQSLKALCGHMACHSKNNNNSYDDHSGTSEKLKDLIADSQSDIEASAPSKRSGFERMRYKIIGANASSLSPATGSLSFVSDNEQEQEELAMCLMMLSRDSGFKGGFSSTAESSDNNSLVFEDKSSYDQMKISLKNGVKCVFNGNEILYVNKAKERQVKSREYHVSENSDSGYFNNGPTGVESEVSVGLFMRKVEPKKHKEVFGSGSDGESDTELGKRLSRFRRVKTQSGRASIEEDGYDQTDRASVKYDSRKRSKHNSYDPEFHRNDAKKVAKGTPIGENRFNNETIDGYTDSVYESGENSVDTDYVPSPLPNNGKIVESFNGKKPIQQNLSRNANKRLVSKKGKLHECPFCLKVFRSGQALGGHKRSHFVGSADDSTLVIKTAAPELPMTGLIDLNLPPAPVVEEVNGFVPW